MLKLFHTNYEAHSAFTNFAVLECKSNSPTHGVLYAMHTIPWRNVHGIGYHTEQSFLSFGLPDLTALFIACSGDEQLTRHFLHMRGIALTEKTLGNIFHWYKLATTVIERRRNNALPTNAVHLAAAGNQ